ncbi:MAG: hypothetical protein U1A77_21355 [Pirellulales bacterium]
MRRRWQHLDTCRYETRLQARSTRPKCPEHGVKAVRVSRTEFFSRSQKP